MSATKIEWADARWNPVTGCSRVSEGCRNCYAERMAKRLAGRCEYPADDPFSVTFHPGRLHEPTRWRKPRRVFVCSMADLFHDDVDVAWLHGVFDVISACAQHTFMVLTKRPERMFNFFAGTSGAGLNVEPMPNLWLGVSVENQAAATDRIGWLLDTPAAVRFVSCEPLLGPVDLLPWMASLDWVIVGGESGPGARPMHPYWVRNIRDLVVDYERPFFFKQWGGRDKKLLGRGLDGRTWDQFPEITLCNFCVGRGNYYCDPDICAYCPPEDD